MRHFRCFFTLYAGYTRDKNDIVNQLTKRPTLIGYIAEGKRAEKNNVDKKLTKVLYFPGI